MIGHVIYLISGRKLFKETRIPNVSRGKEYMRSQNGDNINLFPRPRIRGDPELNALNSLFHKYLKQTLL